MVRKDFYKVFMSMLVALTALVAAPAARAQSTATPSGTRIDAIVSVAYQETQAGPILTLFSNVASVTVTQPVVAIQSAATAGVILTPAQSTQRIIRPALTIYPLTIRNTGQAQDTFSLTLTATAGWTGSLSGHSASSPLLVTLQPGQAWSVRLVVTPPAVLTRSTVGAINVQAVSQNDPTQTAQVTAATTCGAGALAVTR